MYTTRIARSYDQFLPRAFRMFSLWTAARTFLPTCAYYARRPALPASEKPALFTMNILPSMMTVWHHFARRSLGDNVDITVFDCSGRLDPKEFPGCRVQKFINLYASSKCDEFLRSIARNRNIAWICDDDVFFMSEKPLEILRREFAVPKTASVSFRPRGWWNFSIGGKTYPVSGSYCIAFDRNIWMKERMSLAPADSNPHAPSSGKKPRRYDTGDKANELLIERGYRCFVVSPEEERACIAAYSGISGGVVLLDRHRDAQGVLRFFRSPPPEAWKGNLLHGLLSAILAIRTVHDLATRIRGHEHPLPSLPSHADLLQLRREKEPLLRPDQSFQWIDATSDRLRAGLGS